LQENQKERDNQEEIEVGEMLILKLDLKDVTWGGMGSTNLAQDRDR
jgi:hypothetical protein